MRFQWITHSVSQLSLYKIFRIYVPIFKMFFSFRFYLKSCVLILTNEGCVILASFGLFICVSVFLCFYLLFWFTYLSITSHHSPRSLVSVYIESILWKLDKTTLTYSIAEISHPKLIWCLYHHNHRMYFHILSGHNIMDTQYAFATDYQYILGDPEVTANLYSNFAYPYWEGCVICSIYLR